MTPPISAFERTITAQRTAADPALSAFVLANAGSGKTRVLIDRVARLLLKGVAPEKILCITFTKAAAAEMTTRLFSKLGAWSLSSDEALADALRDLQGDGAGGEDFTAARRLFARALETPGGLKIQTIHSFCEGVLRRFPLEAGVAPGFAVLSDTEAAALAADALEEVAARGPAGLHRLGKTFSPLTLRPLLLGALGARQSFLAARAHYGDAAAMKNAVADRLGVSPDDDENTLRDAWLNALSRHDIERAENALAQSGGNGEKHFAPALRAFLAASSPSEQWAHTRSLFLTTTGAPRKKIATKKTDDIDPWVKPFLVEAQTAFVDAEEKIKAHVIVQNTGDYLEIFEQLFQRYKKKKAARAGLDYDDLIIRTKILFADGAADWIMYKLDQGIDHILIDEAQDTSPGQWDIVEGPLKEMLAGAGARARHGDGARTFFAVGDKKQSIYSFQGADVDLFSAKEHDLGKALAASGAYKNVALNLSFRTTAPVLKFVDALFPEGEALQGLGAEALHHPWRREGEAGLVELWPLTPQPEKRAPNPWDAPIDTPQADDPVRLLTAAIASDIKDWLQNGEPLASRGRPVGPGDVMILVQSRGRLFDEMIRALARAGVPVAGADKLKLLEDPAVEDLLALARVALNPEDDLSLAEVLKSPFIGFDEDALFHLAAHRGPASLMTALKDASEDDPRCADAVAWLMRAHDIAEREGPFAFFSTVLDEGTPSGRRRLYERLSLSVQEAIDELLRQALEYERGRPRALGGFVDWFTAHAGEVKREMDRADDAVRVMTVHGAKGLEADIVFLLDAHRGPNLKSLGPLFPLTAPAPQTTSSPPLPALSPAKDRDCAALAAARALAKAKQYEEYRRLFYVAATRARDRLYICGVESGRTSDPLKKPPGEQTWHALATSAFTRLETSLNGASDEFSLETHERWGAPAHRFSSPQRADVDVAASTPAKETIETPPWLFVAARPEKPRLQIAPSRLADAQEERESAPATAPSDSAYPPTSNAYARGRILHRLLELLPDIAPADRPYKADLILTRLAPDMAESERARWREEVLAVLSDPEFAPVFAPGSLAEVAVAGAPAGLKDGARLSGQIDRLAVCEDRVLVVDYKTNRPPPRDPAGIAPVYLRQMAAYRALLQEIYQGRQIVSALLWTYDARLMTIPDAMLDHAFAHWRAG